MVKPWVAQRWGFQPFKKLQNIVVAGALGKKHREGGVGGNYEE
jgi:hypothetical protein